MSAPASQKRRDWLRDLPLLAGMLASAALMFAPLAPGSGDDRRSPKLAEPAREGVDLIRERGGLIRPAIEEGDPADLADEAGEAARKQAKPKPRKRAAKAAAGDDLNARELEKLAQVDAPKPAGGEKPAKKKSPAADPAPAAEEVPSAGGSEDEPEPVESEPVEVTRKSAKTTVGEVSFALAATSHAPRRGEQWVLTAAAAGAEGALAGKVRAHVLYQGKVASHFDTARMKKTGYRFEVRWPERSVGYPITLRIVVSAGGQSQTFFYDLKVRPAA